MELIKCKDIDRRCTNCNATMKTEMNEIDKAMGTTNTKQTFELLIGNSNTKIQIILCKECLKELSILSDVIYRRYERMEK